ncbi:MAG: retropepsin-like aspartic protease, partial [Acidobacteriota bacterium]
ITIRTLREGFPFVEVLINGHGPFRMLFDTGANASLLTPQAAKIAELSFDHRSILTTFAGDRIVPGGSRNVIEVGGVSQSNLPILVLDLPEVHKIDSRADGVLGQSFFHRIAYLLDYKQKRLWLGLDATREAQRLANEVAAVRFDGRTVLPVTLEPGGPVWQLTMDSGASNLVIDCNLGCPRAADLQRGASLATHNGERPVSHGTLRNVAIGGLRMPPADTVMLQNVSTEHWDDGVVPTRWFDAFYVKDQVVRFDAAR